MGGIRAREGVEKGRGISFDCGTEKSLVCLFVRRGRSVSGVQCRSGDPVVSPAFANGSQELLASCWVSFISQPAGEQQR